MWYVVPAKAKEWSMSQIVDRCEYRYEDCLNEAMWGARYCVLHIDEKYAHGDSYEEQATS